MNTAGIADGFQDTVDGSDDAAFAADISWRARVAGRIFGGHHDGVTDLVFAARFAHRPPQSGRTRGISASPWAASLARCSPGSTADPAHVGSAIPHAQFFVGRNVQRKHFRNAPAWILHDLSPVALMLVPPGRVAENVVGVTGA